MWHHQKTVRATHAKNGTQMAWAIIAGVGADGWIRIRPHAPDGVTNVFKILCTAHAHGREVDVYVRDGQIEQATLR